LGKDRLAGAEEVDEKALDSDEELKSIPQGLKPALIRLAIMPGMNPRPTVRMSFSAACKARLDR
jgi:hypothetical protein